MRYIVVSALTVALAACITVPRPRPTEPPPAPAEPFPARTFTITVSPITAHATLEPIGDRPVPVIHGQAIDATRQRFVIPAGTPIWGGDLDVVAPGYESRSVWVLLESQDFTWPDPIVLKAIPPPASPPVLVAGCNPATGLLENDEAWFFSHIGKVKGSPATDWVATLAASCLPAGHPPGVIAGPACYGFTQQRGAAGRYVGRIFRPTTIPDDGGYYTSPVDVLDDNPAGPPQGCSSDPKWCVWAYRIDRSKPPYAPRACP